MRRFNIIKILFMITAGLLFSGSAIIISGQNLIPVWGRPVRSIVIDPGHGGYDDGAIGPEGTTEKEVTLALARLTAAKLASRYRVLLTRTGDYRVEISSRAAMANHQHADLFLSLHVGGGFSTQYSGITVFFLNVMAEQSHNAATFPETGIEDRPGLAWDEAHYNHHRLSKAFANIMENASQKVPGNRVRVKSDRMAVLQGLNMPAVMIEIGCLTNPSEERQFRDPDSLAGLSNMLCEAIDAFFKSDQTFGGDNAD